MSTFDDKWAMTESKKEHGFLNFKQLPSWTSQVWRVNEIVSIVGGEADKPTTDNIILGAYFFVDDYRVEHSRKVYTLL